MTAPTVSASFSNYEPIRSRPHADAMAREAARILAALIDHLHAGPQTRRGMIPITAELPVCLADRLALWGSPAEDLEEDDPPEDDGEAEPDTTERNEVPPEGGWDVPN